MVTATQANVNPIELIIYRSYGVPENTDEKMLSTEKFLDPSKIFIWKAARCSRLLNLTIFTIRN